MDTSSNEVPFQNQLTMGGVTHKLIYMLKLFNFINVGQHPLSYSDTSLHVWATTKAQHVHTILIKRERWQIKIEQPALIPQSVGEI